LQPNLWFRFRTSASFPKWAFQKSASVPVAERPRKEFESQRWFKLLQRFRAGIESIISLLKRKFGLDRNRYKGTAGNKQWVGLGIMAYNLRRMAQLC
jgi:IS5 family transposase